MLRPTRKVGWLPNVLRPTRKVGWLPNKVVASNQKGRLAPRQGSTQQKLCFTFISITPESGGGSPILVTVGRPRRFTRHPRGIRAELPSIMVLGDGLNGLYMRHQDVISLFSSMDHHQMKCVREAGPYQTISRHHGRIGTFKSREVQLRASGRKRAATLIHKKKRGLHRKQRINKRQDVGLFSSLNYNQMRCGW